MVSISFLCFLSFAIVLNCCWTSPSPPDLSVLFVLQLYKDRAPAPPSRSKGRGRRLCEGGPGPRPSVQQQRGRGGQGEVRGYSQEMEAVVIQVRDRGDTVWIVCRYGV